MAAMCQEPGVSALVLVASKPVRLGFLCRTQIGVQASFTTAKTSSVWEHNEDVTDWGISWQERADAVVELQLNCKVGARIMKGFGTNVIEMWRLSNLEVGLDVTSYLRIEKTTTTAIVLPVAKCNHDLCMDSGNEHGMQFIGSPNVEDVIASWETIDSDRRGTNDHLNEGVEIPKKKCIKKKITTDVATTSDVVKHAPRKKTVIPVLEFQKSLDIPQGSEHVHTSQAPRGSKPGSRKRKVSEAQSADMTMEEALEKASLKGSTELSHSVEINAAIARGLAHCFPFGKQKLSVSGKSVMVPLSRLHVAPGPIKYREIIAKRVDQITTDLTAFELVHARQPIFCLPLKNEPGDKVDPNQCQNLILPEPPKSIDEVADAHFYISGGQHTVEACKRILAERDDLSDQQKKELDEHEVVIVWETKPHILRCLSRALNLRLEEKDCKESYVQQLEKAREIWIQMDRPAPSECGGKHSPEFLAFKTALVPIFAGKDSSDKYGLLTIEDSTWDAWKHVFNIWNFGQLPDAKGEAPYGTIVKPIVKHDLSFTIGMRDEDLRLLAKEVAGSRVYLKATKDSKLKTLKEWCDEAKMDRVVMNEIMYKLKNKPLPSKSSDYKRYSEHEWLEVEAEFGFSREVIANFRAEIRKSSIGKEWMERRAHMLRPTNAVKNPAPDIFNSMLDGFSRAREGIGSTQSITGSHFGSSTKKLQEIYMCRTALTTHLVEVECGNEEVEEFMKGMSVVALVCGFEDDGSSLDLGDDDVKKIHAITEDTEGYPTGPALWITDLYNHHEVAMALRSNCNSETECIFYVPEHADGFGPSPVHESSLLSFTISYNCEVEEGQERDRFKSFKKQSRISSKLPSILYASCFGSSQNWESKICHLNLEAINKVLQPMLTGKTLLLNVWGGSNITNIGLRYASKVVEFIRVDDTSTSTTTASNMLAFLRGQGSMPADKDPSCAHKNVYVDMDIVDPLGTVGGGTTSTDVRSESSPPSEHIEVQSPNRHATQTQASSSNLVDVLNVQVLPVPLSPKGQTHEGQVGTDSESDILEVPLPAGIVPEIETVDLHISDLAETTKANVDIPILENDTTNIAGGDHLVLLRLDSVSVVVVDSHMQDDVRFVAEKHKGKMAVDSHSDVSISQSKRKRVHNEMEEGRSKDLRSKEHHRVVIQSDTEEEDDALDQNKRKKTKSLLQVAPQERGESTLAENEDSGGKAARPKKKRSKKHW